MIRIGTGYDSHRFCPDRKLILGGVEIPCPQGLAGHSDADALLHAITDALLGALAAGDIGQRFPPSDPRWKDADSTRFVTEACQLLARQGASVVNCDATVITETPRLAPHIPAMRQRVAQLLNIDPARVSIKAKTNEKMGSIGRGEGLAAQAVVLIADSRD